MGKLRLYRGSRLFEAIHVTRQGENDGKKYGEIQGELLTSMLIMGILLLRAGHTAAQDQPDPLPHNFAFSGLSLENV
jgi:hypothetical protein